MTPSPHTKHRKKPAAPSVTTGLTEQAALHQEIGYKPLTLQDVRDRMYDLCRRVPPVPADGFAAKDLAADDLDSGSSQKSKEESTVPVAVTACPYDQGAVKAWAVALQSVLEEFYLLIAVVSVATYRWGTDRSGAADQNVNLLLSELQISQEQIATHVAPCLNDVLAPVVSLLNVKTVTTKLNDASEVKKNYFITAPVDPEYVVQCYVVLARNAAFHRQVVLAYFDKLLSALTDYLEATQKDSQHDARKFLY
jgi:hypothetical protein